MPAENTDTRSGARKPDGSFTPALRNRDPLSVSARSPNPNCLPRVRISDSVYLSRNDSIRVVLAGVSNRGAFRPSIPIVTAGSR